MVRVIAHNWQTVLGYWFLGGKETALQLYNIVLQCVTATTEAGLVIKAVVSDQGPANQGLAKKLGINTKNFIYYVPHLLKSTRNMFAKYDLMYKNEVISWRRIKKAVESTHPVRLRLIPKVGLQHACE